MPIYTIIPLIIKPKKGAELIECRLKTIVR